MGPAGVSPYRGSERCMLQIVGPQTGKEGMQEIGRSRVRWCIPYRIHVWYMFIWLEFMVNVAEKAIHGSYGYFTFSS